MITSITSDPHPFVLEEDRTNPKEQQTVFYIVPKTVRGSTETAAAYAGVQTEDRRKGKKGIDPKAMQLADNGEWLKAVRKIENFGVMPNCPGATDEISGYAHFLAKNASDPSVYVKGDDGVITVTVTEDIEDLKYIFWSMSPTDTEEVMKAYFDHNELKASLKNA